MEHGGVIANTWTQHVAEWGLAVGYGYPRTPNLCLPPKSHQNQCFCTCMVTQSPEISTRNDWAILGSNCLSGHPPGIKARPRAPEWSHRYESWSFGGHLVDPHWWIGSREQRIPQRREMGTRVPKDIGPGTLPRWACHSSCPQVHEGTLKMFEEGTPKCRAWDKIPLGPKAVLMSRMTNNIN